MGKLSVTYDIKLPTELWLYRSQQEKPYYQVRYQQFDVQVVFGSEEDWKEIASVIKEASDPIVLSISEMQITVSRNEIATIPDATPADNDNPLSSPRWKYIKEREDEYKAAALEILNRTLLFFKYRLHQSRLNLVNSRIFSSVSWNDEQGDRIIFSPYISLELNMEHYGERLMRPENDTAFLEALENRIVPQLHEEILSDAIAAIHHKNNRRTVLEMAIACEIIIKQAFFAKSTPAGEAFEFLEEQRQVEVSNLDLIHKVAKRAFGESFKEKYPDDYKNVDYLFRCRNKVAHRGQVIYRDDKGNLQEVGQAMLRGWWESIDKLISWLNGFKA